MTKEAQDIPLFVPVALPEAQAMAALAAVRTLFHMGSLRQLGEEGEEAHKNLAGAMLTLATAIDNAREARR